MGLRVLEPGGYVKGRGKNYLGVKEETHAARWGLLRGYSGKATKWVDFVVTDSTRRESCHRFRVLRIRAGVKGEWWKKGVPGEIWEGKRWVWQAYLGRYLYGGQPL